MSAPQQGPPSLVEQTVDAWELPAAGAWVLVPTNTQCRRDGTAAMGVGLGRAAASRFPDLPARYGRALAAGNTRVVIADRRVLLAPAKTHWRLPAHTPLALQALDAVARWCAANPDQTLVVPALGCGLGGLEWEPVRAATLERLSDHRVVLVPPAP